MTTPLLKVDHLKKRFGSRIALHDVSFHLPENRILTILGPSGCGKTTLLRVIAGLQKPDEGKIWINGQMMNGQGAWVPPQDRSVGMIFQNLALWPHLTVKGNIGLGLKTKGIERRTREQITRAILEKMQMASHGDRYPHLLSVGEQQRVALARSLVLEPKLLLLDEPFSHLDWDLRRDLIQLIRNLKATIMFVTHDQIDAFAMGGLMAVMRKGRFEQMGKADEILERPSSDFVRRFVKIPRD